MEDDPAARGTVGMGGRGEIRLPFGGEAGGVRPVEQLPDPRLPLVAGCAGMYGLSMASRLVCKRMAEDMVNDRAVAVPARRMFIGRKGVQVEAQRKLGTSVEG